jgi:uncharacterized protein Yka (UPF0111/DUF47 family)
VYFIRIQPLLQYTQREPHVKSLKRILVIGEQNIFGEITEIISIAGQANVLLAKMLGAAQNASVLDECMQGIKELEKRSDNVAFRVSEDITAGAVSPNIIDNLLASVGMADDIVDTYYYLSREIYRMSKSKFPYSEALEESEWASLFTRMLGLADGALAKLKIILSTSDFRSIAQLRREIETLEEQGDDMKDEGFDWLYREAPSMHYLEFYHYTELLHKFDDILDSCEDLSDLIVSIITSIVK